MNSTEKWKYAKVPIEQLEAASMNANKMTEQELDRLTKNIKISGLSSVITCYKKTGEDRYIIISGHHRVKACTKLGHKEIGILYADEADLSPDEIIAIQTSHNSLHGQDDMSILKKLFDQIQSVEFKEFAYINMDEIGTIETNSAAFSPEVEEYTVSLVLYKNDMQRLQDLIGIVGEMAPKSDLVVIADGDKTEELMLKLMKEVRDRYDIKSSSTAFCKILEMAQEYMNAE